MTQKSDGYRKKGKWLKFNTKNNSEKKKLSEPFSYLDSVFCNLQKIFVKHQKNGNYRKKFAKSISNFATLLKVTLLHVCFFLLFLDCANSLKLCKASD